MRRIFFVLVLLSVVTACGCDSTTTPEPGPPVGGDVTVVTESPPFPQPISDIWMASADRGYAVCGEGAILECDGGEWSVDVGLAGRPLYAVWGTAMDDVYVGGASILLHYDGTEWRDVRPAPAFSARDIWGTGPADVFVSTGYAVSHFDGSDWRADTLGVAVYSIHGTAPDDVYAATGRGVYHYAGDGWSRMEGAADRGVSDVWVGGPNDVWATWGYSVLRYDGSGWEETGDIGGNAGYISRFHGFAPDDIYAIGRGSVYRFDGTTWRETADLKKDLLTLNLMAIGGATAEALWVGGGSGAGLLEPLRRGEPTGPPRTVVLRNTYAIRSIPFSDDVYAATSSGVIVRRDDRWQHVEPAFGRAVQDVRVVGPSLYALSAGQLYRNRGQTWAMLSGERFDAVSASGGELLAAGSNGLYRVRGDDLEPALEFGVDLPRVRQPVIAGSMASTALMLAATYDYPRQLVIARYDGHDWRAEVSREAIVPGAITMMGRDEYLMASISSPAGVWHIQGDEWRDVTPEGFERNLYIMGGNESVGFAVLAGYRTLYLYDRTGWDVIDLPFEHQIISVSDGPGEAVYLGGIRGLIARMTRE